MGFELNREYAPPSFIVSILVVMTGVLILLFGMRIVSYWRTDTWASCVDVLFVVLGLLFVAHGLRLPQAVGRRAILAVVLSISIWTLLCILFARIYVFTVGEEGQLLSFHEEHNLTFFRIRELSRELMNGSLDSAHKLALGYGQYAYTYLYSSLMYVFGGEVITHICVWNGFHLGIVAILCVLIAKGSGMYKKESLKCILLLTLLQPSYLPLYVYNRSIIGEFFLLIGLFLFVKSVDSPLKLLLLLPVYGFLFYAFRLQYLLLAVGLFLVFSISPRNKHKEIGVLGFLMAFVVLLVLLRRVDWATDIEEGLNVSNYTSAYSRSFIVNLMIGLIGKFPWTNWLSDNNWTYHVFVSLQAPMMLVLYYYTIKLNKKNLNAFVSDPVLVCACLLLLAGFISSTHTTYLAVAAPLLVVRVSEVPLSKIMRSYGRVSVVYVLLSIIWFALGLTNTGVFSG